MENVRKIWKCLDDSSLIQKLIKFSFYTILLIENLQIIFIN